VFIVAHDFTSRLHTDSDTPAAYSFHMQSADTTFLSLLVQRLLDSEVLSETEGATLREEADAAGRCLLEGDNPAARRHVEQVAIFTEAIVPGDGRAVIDAARRILADATD